MTPLVYPAARFHHQVRIREIRTELRSYGIRVEARWPDEEPALESTNSDVHRARLALADFEDVRASSCLLFWNPKEDCFTGKGGCHVETGMMLERERPVFIVGVRSNVFHWLDGVSVHATVREAADAILEWWEREGKPAPYGTCTICRVNLATHAPVTLPSVMWCGDCKEIGFKKHGSRPLR